MKNWSTIRNTLLSVSTLVAVVSCGGGSGSGTPVGGASAKAVSSGVMQKGSVILNGIHYEVPASASITIDNQLNQPESALHSGMVVKVRGTINADGVTGVVEKIEAQDELQGKVESINATANPKSLIVLGQTVVVDDLTLYSNASSFADLAANDYIEVHGQPDLNGIIRATRIEKFSTAPSDIELKGTVSSKTVSEFMLRGLTIHYDSTTVISSGSVFADGDYVEVHLDTTTSPYHAVKVDLEDAEDVDFKPSADDEYELEGYVSGFSAHPGSFFVNGKAVTTTSSTKFEGGSALNLANDIKVEAEGSAVGNVLVAEKIKFKRTRVKLTGLATAVDVTNKTIIVFGKTIVVNSLTKVSAEPNNSSSLSDISANVDRVKVKGFIDSTGAIIAEEVKETTDNKDEIQARVSAVTNQTLTLLGVLANLSSATKLGDAEEAPLSTVQAFLADIAPTSASNSGTLVELEGTYSATNNTFTVDEAAIEN